MAASFIEERFPLSVSFGASGGPQWHTQVVTLASGAEARNARWARSRRRYDAGTGVRSLADLAAVAAFFDRVRGRLTGFRFRDPFDNASSPSGGEVTPADCLIGTGDGQAIVFRLVRPAGAGVPRVIAKPVAGTVRVAVGGTELFEGTGFSLDATTGLVTLVEAPGPGVAISAGFRFDVPVRFDSDRLDMSLTHFEAGRVPSIPLVEIDPET